MHVIVCLVEQRVDRQTETTICNTVAGPDSYCWDYTEWQRRRNFMQFGGQKICRSGDI